MRIRKVLIANRGEIALRILRTCREIGLATVCVHSTADAKSMHVRLADESVCIGPPSPQESYLNIPSLIAAAEITGADAIHPGYGFLSESHEFAQIVSDHGLVFVGPEADHIRDMGDKIVARTTAANLGLPTVPGTELDNDGGPTRWSEQAKQLGYPLIIKAADGGGGRGMKIVEDPSLFIEGLEVCRSESMAAFNSDRVYLERYLKSPRHIEIQVMGDGLGNVLHFWERDCSVQRRHQKVIEEAPSTAITHEMRADICETTRRALETMKYKGAGTVEYLFENGQFYFIEMNTRIQVEHGVSELITGHDLIGLQLRVAGGQKLSLKQNDIGILGHAIEMRINAEDPFTFTPSPGRITNFHSPGGAGVRIDSGLYSGLDIPPFYDSLIVKMMTFGADRDIAISRMRGALQETVIEGVKVNIPLLQLLLDNESYCKNEFDVNWLERNLPQILQSQT